MIIRSIGDQQKKFLFFVFFQNFFILVKWGHFQGQMGSFLILGLGKREVGRAAT